MTSFDLLETMMAIVGILMEVYKKHVKTALLREMYKDLDKLFNDKCIL